MRCKYCHNPDTWNLDGGTLRSVETIVNDVKRYKNYYGGEGKITVSGGEPLLQLDFLIELFEKCKLFGIETCLDTSGICFNENDLDKYQALIKNCDLIMLDIKHPNNTIHQQLCGLPNETVWKFLGFLNEQHKTVWIRYVLVPTITTDEQVLMELKQRLDGYACIQKIEVLPYHKMGIVKYDNLGIDYPLKEIDEPTKEQIIIANKILGGNKNGSMETV